MSNTGAAEVNEQEEYEEIVIQNISDFNVNDIIFSKPKKDDRKCTIDLKVKVDNENKAIFVETNPMKLFDVERPSNKYAIAYFEPDKDMMEFTYRLYAYIRRKAAIKSNKWYGAQKSETDIDRYLRENTKVRGGGVVSTYFRVLLHNDFLRLDLFDSNRNRIPPSTGFVPGQYYKLIINITRIFAKATSIDVETFIDQAEYIIETQPIKKKDASAPQPLEGSDDDASFVEDSDDDY